MNLLKLYLLSFFLLLLNYSGAYSQSSRDYLDIGNEKYSKEEYDNAFDDFNKAVELDNNSPEAFFGRGKCRYAFSQFEQAIADFSAAIKFKSGFYEAYLYRGNAWLKLENTKEALNDYNKAISKNPKYKDAYIQRSFLYRRLNDPDGALNDLNIAINIGTDNADVYYLRADMLNKEYNQKEKAISDYTKAIEINHKFAEAYYYRGLCYEALKQYKNAADDLTKTIELGKIDTLAYKTRAMLFMLTENYEAAVADYTTLIHKYRVNNELVFFNRGICYNRLSGYENAVKDLTRALMFNRLNIDAYLERAQANIKMNLISTAISDFQSAEKTEPKNIKIYETRGDMYKNQHKYNMAIDDYTKGLSYKSNAVLLFKRGQCRELLNEKTPACEDYRHAAELNYEEAKKKLDVYCR